MREEIEKIAKIEALKNAISYGGKASFKHVVSKVIAYDPKFKQNIKEVIDIVKKIVEDVNSMSLEEQKEELRKYGVEEKNKGKEKEDTSIDPLPFAEEGKIVVRFAPNPDGALHIGNARAAVINDEYAKIYKGKFILRFEDTDPKNKRPLLEAYSWIIEDLEWLNVNIHEIHYQSKRIPIYYKYIKKLLEEGFAYVCLCSKEEISHNRRVGKECVHRNNSPEKNLELFDKIFENEFREGEAVIRIKTDMNHPNPSVRDWIAFRIIENPNHPIVGNKYILWPTYNFANVIDDFEMGITHVIRMKEHNVNSMKQEYIYKYLNIKKPIIVEYGAIIVNEFEMHKSKIKEKILSGDYKGWEDPNLITIRALRYRGYTPSAIRKYLIHLGINPNPAKVNFGIINKFMKEEIDRKSPRYSFVENPIKLIVTSDFSEIFKVKKHPSENLGYKYYQIGMGDLVFWIDRSDKDLFKESSIVRLKELFNVEVVEIKDDNIYAKVSDNQEISKDIRKIHWVLDCNKVKAVVYAENKEIEGFIERNILFEERDIVQLERKFYAKIVCKDIDCVKLVKLF